jgi:hypothetical protein
VAIQRAFSGDSDVGSMVVTASAGDGGDLRPELQTFAATA